MFYLGFDVGGSSLKAVLVKNRKIIKSEIKDLPDNFDSLLQLILELKNDLLAGVEAKEVAGAGFAVAGMLNKERMVMLKSPNISYLDNQPLRKIFEKKLSLPVRLEHDAHCFLLAEKEVGLVKELKLKNVFLVTLGAGVGGAWMADGKIFSGSHGNLGEVGHTLIKFRTFEEIASNKFVMEKLGVGSVEAFRRAENGGTEAIRVLSELGENIGLGLVNIIDMVDPEAVILAGGIIEAKKFILAAIEQTVEKFVISPAAKKTKILFSGLGRFGGALGAGLLFNQK